LAANNPRFFHTKAAVGFPLFLESLDFLVLFHQGKSTAEKAIHFNPIKRLLLGVYTAPYFSFPGGQKKSNKRKGLYSPAIIPLPELLRKPTACATQAIRGANDGAFT
jgi:hypothetical protein